MSLATADASDRRSAYAPVGEGARVPPLWALPLVPVLLFVLALLVMVVATFVLGTGVALSGRVSDPRFVERWWAALPMTLILFGAMSAVTLAWVRKGERRSLASAGVVRPRSGDLVWWGVGAAWSTLLAGGLMLFAGERFGEDVAAGAVSSLGLAATVVLATLAVVAVLATTEEVVFRGWALSALSTRLGPVWALALSSAAFGALHVFPWEWADPARLLSFLSFACMGAAFGAVALKRRSLWSAAALHSGYNSVLAVAGAWSVGFAPSRIWEGVSEAGTGFDDLQGAMVLAAAQGSLAAMAILYWRYAPPTRSRPAETSPTPA